MNGKNQKAEQKKARWFPIFCIAYIMVLLINIFVIRTAVVKGRSMYPTLEDGEFMIVWQLGYEPAAGDIVVIDTSDSWINREYIVKRVIATEGQTVRVDYVSNTVCIEDVMIDEPYLNYDQEDPMQPVDEQNVAVYTVSPGCIFVMGDNRNHSADSRDARYGMIPEADIVGKVVHVF